MRCIIMANGAYGDLASYRDLVLPGDILLCADGGSNYAFELGLLPDLIIGDLDSIRPEIEDNYRRRGVKFCPFPSRKDSTDFQLCLDKAREMQADQVLVLGSMGKRLDHTLANLYAGIGLVRGGCLISHFSPECRVHITSQDMIIEGRPGDLVSVLALTEEATGVTEQGFEYTPVNPRLELARPYAVSNVMTGDCGKITVQAGILAVFHYPADART
ncbi:MAG: thiamine diphosphokinase [Syntrophomonadaceae bacterium]